MRRNGVYTPSSVSPISRTQLRSVLTAFPIWPASLVSEGGEKETFQVFLGRGSLAKTSLTCPPVLFTVAGEGASRVRNCGSFPLYRRPANGVELRGLFPNWGQLEMNFAKHVAFRHPVCSCCSLRLPRAERSRQGHTGRFCRLTLCAFWERQCSFVNREVRNARVMRGVIKLTD